MIKPEQLERINTAADQIAVFKRVISDLSHYNRRSDIYKDSSQHGDKWWVRVRRLFQPIIKVTKDTVVVDPVSVMSHVEFSAGKLGETDAMKFEIAQSEARILGFMIQETQKLLKIAETDYKKQCEN